MTRKQQARLKRNKEIMSYYRRLPIEDISEKFKLSVPQIYAIMEEAKCK
jgi:Mor family transcriptional regulator